MSHIVKGQVTELGSKTVTAKATGKTFRVHNVVLDTGESVSLGFKQLFKVGDNVTLTVEEKFGELKMVHAGTTTAKVDGPKMDSSPGTRNVKFPIPRTSNEYAIIRQNALTNAVNYHVGNSMAFDPEKVIELAYKFAEFSSGHREERILKEAGEKVVSG